MRDDCGILLFDRQEAPVDWSLPVFELSETNVVAAYFKVR